MDTEFEILDHTADTGIIAYGIDLKKAFENAALGMFSIITDLDGIDTKQKTRISITSSDRYSLLIGWLNELIYLFDAQNLIFNKFDIINLDDTSLAAIVFGEKVDHSRHEIRTGIKAATYHLLKIEGNDICRIQVLFDI